MALLKKLEYQYNIDNQRDDKQTLQDSSATNYRMLNCGMRKLVKRGDQSVYTVVIEYSTIIMKSRIFRKK